MVTDPLSKLDDKTLAVWFEQLARTRDAYDKARTLATDPSFIDALGREFSFVSPQKPWSELSEVGLKAAVTKLKTELDALLAVAAHEAFAKWREQLKQQESEPRNHMLAWLKASEFPSAFGWSAKQSLHFVESWLTRLSATRYEKSQRLTRFAVVLTSVALVGGLIGTLFLWFDPARSFATGDVEEALKEVRERTFDPASDKANVETSCSAVTAARFEQASKSVVDDLMRGRRPQSRPPSEADPRALELDWMQLRLKELEAMRTFDDARADAFSSITSRSGFEAGKEFEDRWRKAVDIYKIARNDADKDANAILKRAATSSTATAPEKKTPHEADTQWGTFAAYVGVTCLIGLALLSWLVVHATLVSRDHLRSSVEAEDRAGFARLALARLALSGTVAANEALDLIALVRKDKDQDKGDDDA